MTEKIKLLYNHIHEKTLESERQIKAFSIIFFINYLLYYFIWRFGSIQSYENLWLRISASMVCLVLMLRAYWPKKLEKFFPLYWYVSVTYCLPYFFLFMTLNTHGSAAWLLNLLLEVMLTFLLFDLREVIVINTIGFALAYLAYTFFENHTVIFEPSTIDVIGAFMTIPATSIMGGIFLHNRGRIEQAKLDATSSLGASIAHELRTPLSSIALGVSGLQDYLPVLIAGYELAKNSGLPVQTIRKDKYEILMRMLGHIEMDTKYANTIINMLLMNAKQKIVQQDTLNLYSMNTCIHEVMENYPFESMEAALVHLDMSYDFEFQGQSLLVKHVLLNLLRNALYFIQAEGKGNIQITTFAHGKYNVLSFKDTARGIEPRAIHKIFDRFYTTTTHGTGLGLAFCKMVMKNLGGDIRCSSKLGEFAKFDLKFPKTHP